MGKRAVIYARYSSHSQNEQSIETQVEICKSYAKKHNLDIVEIYSDKAKTGTNDNREAFQKMLSDSNKKLFDYVLVYNLSRFARNNAESVTNELILNKNKAYVISATENVNGDYNDPMTSFMKNIMTSVNEYYSKNTAKNIRDGLRTNARKGLSIGGLSLPLGYKSNDKKEIIIDEENAPHVKKIFEMYNENNSMAEIVRYLNMHNVKTSRGNDFNKNSILRIVTNKKYIGIYTFKGEEMPVRIPSIIDEKLFNEVQDLVNRKHISHSRKSDYILTDKLYCGLCGAKMTGAVAKKKYHYYKCVNSKGSLKTCHKEKVDREFIEELVIKETRKLLTKNNIKIIADKVMEYIEKEKDLSEIKKLQKAIKNTEKELTSLLESLKQTNNDNVRSLLLNEVEKVQEQQRGLKARLTYEEANNMPISASEIRFFLTELKKGSVNSKKYRRLLIDTFIYKIYLYDEKMVIVYTTQESSEINIPDHNLILSSLEGTTAPPYVN